MSHNDRPSDKAPVRDPDLSGDTLDRFLTGALLPAEAEALHGRMTATPRGRACWQMFQAWLDENDVGEAVDTAAVWTRLERRIASERDHHAPTHSTLQRQPSRRSRRSIITWAAAAIVCLVCVVALTLMRRADHPLDTTRRYTTAPGQRSTVRLADGSLMMLAPATTAEVTSEHVTIHGAAYFQLTPHPTRPFTVETRNATVRVLGTRFVVRQYPDEPQSQVAVEDGKVALLARRSRDISIDTASTPLVLTASTAAQVTDSGITVQQGVMTRDYTSWTRGQLVFRKVPLHDVAAELSRAYGADIRVTDSTLAQRRMTIQVTVQQESLSDVLNGIGLITNAHVSRVDGAFLLSPGPLTSPTPRDRTVPQSEKLYGK